jgi:pilus assembly protein CpaE
MTTVIEPDVALAHSLSGACGATDALASISAVKQHLDARPEEFALVLGPGVDQQSAINLAQTLRVTRPTLSVILVRNVVDTAVLADALRSGMREVVATSDIRELRDVVNRAFQLYQALTTQQPGAPRRRGQLLTVFSAKGGVGKTTVATNLSTMLASDQTRVCLVDLDLAFGDVAITLQIFPSRTIADAVPMQADLDMAGLESLLTPVSDGLVTLVAPVQPDAKDTISSALVARVFELLVEHFDFVVVDTPPSFDDHVLQAFDMSDQILLVTTPDIPALKNLKVALETLQLLNISQDQLKLILNRAQPKVGVTAEEVSASLGMTITAMIPSSADVPASINRGEPIVTADPRHPASRGIAVLAEACAGGAVHHPLPTGGVVPEQPAPQEHRMEPRGSLSRMLRKARV